MIDELVVEILEHELVVVVVEVHVLDVHQDVLLQLDIHAYHYFMDADGQELLAVDDDVQLHPLHDVLVVDDLNIHPTLGLHDLCHSL